MRSPEELQQERIDEIQKEKHLRNEIARLEALTEADGKEIGSYREETGLRGEIKNKDAELDAADAKIERLQARVEALEGVLDRVDYALENIWAIDRDRLRHLIAEATTEDV